jgi:hypothetical protein
VSVFISFSSGEFYYLKFYSGFLNFPLTLVYLSPAREVSLDQVVRTILLCPSNRLTRKGMELDSLPSKRYDFLGVCILRKRA